MISSFFGKTKPINYAVLSIFLILFYACLVGFSKMGTPTGSGYILEGIALIALIFQLIVINEIVRSEKVTGFSSFSMLFFVLLLVTFPEALMDVKGIFANLFILLAVWRLLSMQNLKQLKHKLFDASFFVTIASLFYDWALLYFVLVFLVINVFDRNSFKNWLVPLLAILTTAMVGMAYMLLKNDFSFFWEHYQFRIESEALQNLEYRFIKIVVFGVLILLLMGLVFLKQRKKGGGKLITLRICFLTFILALCIAFFKLESANIIILSFFPTAVFLTNYLETLKESRYKEVATTLLVFIPFFILAVELSL
ncbi:MAG: DUF6427 family protein [Bacteroidota bacterium]